MTYSTNPSLTEFNKVCYALELPVKDKARNFPLKFSKSFPTMALLFLFCSFYFTSKRIYCQDEIKFF